MRLHSGAGNHPDNVFGRIALASARHASIVIAIYVLMASVALAFAIARLEVNTDPGRMISPHLDFRKAFADYTGAFPQLDNTFVVVVDSEQPELAREATRSLAQSFAARVDLFENVFAPGTSSFFDSYGVLYLPTDEVRNIVSEVGQAGPLFKALAQRPDLAGLADLFGQLEQAAGAGLLPASLEPLLIEMARTATGELAGQPHPLDWEKLGGGGKATDKRWYVVVKPRLDYTKLDPAEAAMTEARLIVDDPEVGRSGRVQARLTGEAAVNAEEFEAVIRGATMAGIASFCLVVLVIGFGMPALRLIVPALAMIILGFMITAGFATASVGYLNMISVAFAVLFIGLGIDYAIHVLLRYAEVAKTGISRMEAIAASASGTGPALGVCTLTTSLAFLAFVPTDFVGMAQLGIIAAGGIVVAFVASLTLIPAVLGIIPRPAGWRQRQLALASLIREPDDKKSPVRLAATVIVIVAAVAGTATLPSVRFDGDPINLKDPESSAVKVFRELLHTEPGTVYAAQVLAADEAEAERLTHALKALPSVDSVRAISDLIPEEQSVKLAILRALRGAVPDTASPVEPASAAQLRASLDKLLGHLTVIESADGTRGRVQHALKTLISSLTRLVQAGKLDEAGLRSLERALFVKLPTMVQRVSTLANAEPVTTRNIDPALRNRFVAEDGRWRLEVMPRDDLRDQANLRKFAYDVRSVTSKATGAPVEITGGADAVSTSITIASLSALGLVVFVLLPVLRRPLDILLIIAPIALAAVLLCAYTVLFSAPFNFANVIVLPLLLGLGIDSSVHYVMRAREEIGAQEVTETSTPRAVLISALTTIGSFGTLWLSPRLGMSSMGELLTIAIFISLICTLVVLPQLIQWTIGRNAR
jgi:hopanoid biosynthesis associated RND transporter like protein HpnN